MGHDIKHTMNVSNFEPKSLVVTDEVREYFRSIAEPLRDDTVTLYVCSTYVGQYSFHTSHSNLKRMTLEEYIALTRPKKSSNGRQGMDYLINVVNLQHTLGHNADWRAWLADKLRGTSFRITPGTFRHDENFIYLNKDYSYGTKKAIDPYKDMPLLKMSDFVNPNEFIKRMLDDIIQKRREDMPDQEEVTHNFTKGNVVKVLSNGSNTTVGNKYLIMDLHGKEDLLLHTGKDDDFKEIVHYSNVILDEIEPIQMIGTQLNGNEFLCMSSENHGFHPGRRYRTTDDRSMIYDDQGIPLFYTESLGAFCVTQSTSDEPRWEGTGVPKPDEPTESEEVPRWDIPEGEAKDEEEKEELPELRDLEVKEEIRKMIDKHPVMLIGEVGAAKTTIAMDMAKELDLEFSAIVMTRQTTQSHLLGFTSVTGDYVESNLRKAYENGGLFLIDEIDASDPNTIICLNTIENGFLAFPDKIVYAHKDFRLISTANEEDALHVHVGKNKQDKSVKNRWHRINVIPDLKSRFKEASIKIFRTVNNDMGERGITEKATPRDLKRFEDLLDEGMDILTAMQKTLYFDVHISRDEVHKVYQEAQYWDLPL